MLKILFIICLTLFTAENVLAQSKISSTDVPIASLDINGVNLNMSAGEIISILEARGYKSARNALGFRIMGQTVNDPVTNIPCRSEVMTLRVSAAPGKPRQNFTIDDKPTSIDYAFYREKMSGEDLKAPPVCDVVENIMLKICPNGKNELPCVTRAGSVTNLKIVNQHSSDYSMIYGLQAEIQSQESRVNCTVSVNQSRTGLPQR